MKGKNQSDIHVSQDFQKLNLVKKMFKIVFTLSAIFILMVLVRYYYENQPVTTKPPSIFFAHNYREGPRMPPTTSDPPDEFDLPFRY
jgi:chemotaxis regulatin CheY-phosphate phosphatase CheZ